RARIRLAVPRKIGQAEGDAGAVVDRSAEEARARRARGDGRRQRLQSDPTQGGGSAGRGRLPGRRHAARDRSERSVHVGAQSERRAAVPELAALARGTAAPGPTRRAIRGYRALGFLATAPVAIPGIVLGVGLFLSYARPPLVLYGTLWILLLA